jgi:hypothetical protein
MKIKLQVKPFENDSLSGCGWLEGPAERRPSLIELVRGLGGERINPKRGNDWA